MSSTLAVVARSDAKVKGNPLTNRQLQHYPDTGARSLYLGVVLLMVISLYWSLFVQGAVATKILVDFNMPFNYFIYIGVAGGVAGAFGSLGAGLADRWGRANLAIYGTLICSLLVLFAMPNASSKFEYGVYYAILSIVEGIVLVATPALVRDFSPQVSRGVALSFWTLGPVLGSLVLTQVSSRTLDHHPDWRFQFHIAGIFGLVIGVLALFSLRELSPQLRDQLMVSMKDRDLIEAKAAGIDTEAALKGHWRQMMRADVIVSAIAISVFLLFYFVAVNVFVVYLATTFGYSESRANSLANWWWAADAIALVITGVLSDKFRVRKPFMLIGGLIAIIGGLLLVHATTRPDTSYHALSIDVMLLGIGTGVAYVAWMAGFTETVEKHNPAATATGLAVWGWIIRATLAVSFLAFSFVVVAPSTLVDKGAQAQQLAVKYQAELATAAKLDPATVAALASDPSDPAAGAAAVSQLSAVPVNDVAAVVAASKQYAVQLQTAQALKPSTAQALLANPTDATIGAQAVGELVATLKTTPTDAVARLQALAAVPTPTIALVAAKGPAVEKAAGQLKALAAVPANDINLLKKVHKSASQNADQWRTWWIVCLIGQFLFLPAIFLMTGLWSPRKARLEEQAHAAQVERELAALQAVQVRV